MESSHGRDDGLLDTPLGMLIRKYPDLASVIFDNSIVRNPQKNGKQKDIEDRVKLYDGGGAQYGENCISQK